ncbi:uncharacterized protein LOC123547986 [Mercenaria mercenaria]|uniref:uncharacterized protein LOC123547986 n=1 Tax=Mercenaria mercenaria TaxID=6596 RepID=UPI00234F510A|nr:uncharacterized protein LOC123547986 [Mercenaria mercenaria]
MYFATLGIIFFLIIEHSEQVPKLIYNNKTQPWQEAMTECFSVQYYTGIDKDISAVGLKSDTDIWTAGYASDVKIAGVLDDSFQSLCGFTYLDGVNALFGAWEVLYGDCLLRRNYLYKNGTASELEILTDTFSGADFSQSFRREDLLNATHEIRPGFYWTGETANIISRQLKCRVTTTQIEEVHFYMEKAFLISKYFAAFCNNRGLSLVLSY